MRIKPKIRYIKYEIHIDTYWGAGAVLAIEGAFYLEQQDPLVYGGDKMEVKGAMPQTKINSRTTVQDTWRPSR